VITPPEVIAEAKEHAKIRRLVVREDLPAAIAIVHDGTRFCFYNDHAWEKPTGTQPFLPWSPPPWPCLATVDHEGTVPLTPEAKP